MPAAYKRSEEIDACIDRAYAQWDGRELSPLEIAEMSGIDPSTVKATIRTAFRKLRHSIELSVQHEEACR